MPVGLLAGQSQTLVAKKLVTKTLDEAWQRRGRPGGRDVPLRSGLPIHQSEVPPTDLALSNGAKHEPTGELLG